MLKRFYHVVAIPIRIVLNNFGDYNPHGMMYVLKENEEKVKELVRKNPFTPVDLVQPLVIRANEGDTVEILFENQLPFATGMHFQEADYDVMDSDGSNAGFNENTLVECGEQILYRLYVNHQGIYNFADLGNPASSEQGSNINGLFGALFAQPRGSWWTDPVTGKGMDSGVYADIHHPFLPSHREYAWIFHDEMPTLDLTGNPLISPHTNQETESTHAVNYRYEPEEHRARLLEEGIVCPDCAGEEVHHDSWVFGDPTTPILRGYVGDPAKIRLTHGGVKETHVFHYHVHQWFRDTTDPDSEIIDSQSISPGAWYDISPLYGLGSLQGAIGDAVIHCHLYPHFGIGMWGMNRIFDTLQDGSECYPNGVPIEPLQPLPDRPLPPKPTKEKPGFPNFIPGKVGSKAPRPPLGIVGGREMTELERNAAVANPRPGAVFTDPAEDAGNPPIIEYNISLIEMPVIYNREGWHDPKGRLYVLDEDLDDVLSGKKEPEPLVIHAPAGTVIRVNYTNRLPSVASGDAFQLVARTYENGFHIHFVKFDVLVADGANVGWNYDSGILPGETIRYEYFADVEVRAWFFHDHLFPLYHQQHGVFGSGVVHPRFTKVIDSKTGERIKHGTQVTAVNPLIPDYRDFVLMVQDFTMLFDKKGNPLNPPPFPGSQDDPGLFGVNYKNEPLQFRLGEDKDPAYSFSSYVEGDPITPILHCYEGDPIRIRLLQGAQEESHSFNLHGLRWKQQRPNILSKFNSQQQIGISESFTFEMDVPQSGDYLWTFETEEDLWNGLWGLIRAFDEEVDFLIPLPDREPPPERTKPLPKCTGEPPKKADIVLSPKGTPKNAPVKRFDIVAFQTPIKYSKWGEHDPYGIVFALKEDMNAILSGKKNPEPLVIRANHGDLVEVKLTSYLDFKKFPFPDGIWPYPPVKEQAFYPPSVRISLHSQLISYDVKTSAGETVGFNFDQTAGPGETVTYKWFVDHTVGACGMWDMADIRNHRSLGTYGAFIAEPRGTETLDPYTREPVRTGSNVIIRQPFLPEIREFTLVLYDGARLEDKKDQLIIDPVNGILLEEAEPDEDLLDTYDNGSRGFNYRTERLINRLLKDDHLKDLFSSKVFGDPSTPLFEAYPGDPIMIRLVNPSERRRSHTFHIHNHYWNSDELVQTSQIKSSVGEIIAGHASDLAIHYGAGSYLQLPGDYLYRSANIRWDLEQGMWGLIRVHSERKKHLPPLAKYSKGN